MKDYTELKNKNTEFIKKEEVYGGVKAELLEEKAQLEINEIKKEMKNQKIEFDKFLPKKKVLKFKDFSINWDEDYYRAKLGFTDKAASTDNEVYYNAYLVYNLVEDTSTIQVFINHSEKDDYAQYDFDVKISDTDLKKILARILLMQI